MISKSYNYAIVGANNNPEKYGYKVFKDLLDNGYKVTPINPNEDEVLGVKTYKNISDYDGIFDVVIFIVPPKVTEIVLQDVKNKGIKNVWFQPGSESDKGIQFCKNNGIDYISNACIMVQKNYTKDQQNSTNL